MQSIAELSEFVVFRSEAAREMVWEWFSAYVLSMVVSRARDNLLVRVRERFSLARVIKGCEGYRKYNGGRGQAAEYGLGGLCWAILIRRLYAWDYRTLEEQIRVNLLVRWATGFGLHERTPDHTVLCRFEEWLRTHDLDGMFVTILEQIDTDYAEEQTADFIGDTFGMWANIRDVSLNTLLRQTCERLLAALRKAVPDAYALCTTEIDHVALFGTKEEKPEGRLSPAEQEERTVRTAQAATACLAVVERYIAVQPVTDEGQAAAMEEVRDWSGNLSKILADEFTTKPLPVKKEPSGCGAKQGKQKATQQKTVSEAVVTAAAVTAAAVAEAVVTAAAVTEAVVTAAAVTEGVVAEAAVTEGVVAEAVVTEGVVTEGVVAEAVVTEAAVTEGVVTAAVVTAAVVTEAVVAEAYGVDKQTTNEPGPETAMIGSTAPQRPTTGVAVPQSGTLRRCLAQERGSFRIISAVDPDATVRVHGKSIILGFNVGVLASAHFVRYIYTLTGSTSDGSFVAPLIGLHLACLGFSPDKYIFDRAAGSPKYIADVARTSEGKTQLVARQIVQGKHSELYHPDDFTLSAAGLTCPNGVMSTTAFRAGSSDGWDYIFPASACKDCPLWHQCRKPGAKPDGNRSVFISDYIVICRQQLAYLDSAQAKVDFAFRSNVERVIAALTRFNDARRARVRGLLKVGFQNLMAATAFNLKTWFTLTRQDERKGLKEKPAWPQQRLYPLF